MSDHRDVARHVCPVLTDLDAAAMRATFTRETARGLTITHRLVLVYVVCPTCEGRGSHVDPGVDRHGLSREDFDADPDFREDYFSGAYDVPCGQCQGLRVVPDVNEATTKPAILAAYHAAVADAWQEAAYAVREREMGY
jgi:hypothetical protein